VAGCCEYGNEPSGSMKGREFLDQLGGVSQEESLLHVVTLRYLLDFISLSSIFMYFSE
jgi:hypothetical protein